MFTYVWQAIIFVWIHISTPLTKMWHHPSTHSIYEEAMNLGVFAGQSIHWYYRTLMWLICQGVDWWLGSRNSITFLLCHLYLYFLIIACYKYLLIWCEFNWLRPGDDMWWIRSGLQFTEVMSCWLTVRKHYFNHCCLIMKGVLWQSSESTVTSGGHEINSWFAFKLQPRFPGATQLVHLTIYSTYISNSLHAYYSVGHAEIIWHGRRLANKALPNKATVVLVTNILAPGKQTRTN